LMLKARKPELFSKLIFKLLFSNWQKALFPIYFILLGILISFILLFQIFSKAQSPIPKISPICSTLFSFL
jgi:hypothetical protein